MGSLLVLADVFATAITVANNLGMILVAEVCGLDFGGPEEWEGLLETDVECGLRVFLGRLAVPLGAFAVAVDGPPS